MANVDDDLLFVKNPKRFMEVLRMEDARERFEALRDFDDVVICEIMRYGVMNEEAMVPPLQELYPNTRCSCRPSGGRRSSPH